MEHPHIEQWQQVKLSTLTWNICYTSLARRVLYARIYNVK
ncbi:hypothetical protein BH10CHL1_BH10CHL1_20260 [soil metagenome]